jgi:cell division protein FtsW (lipid II flippase)
MKKFDSKHMAFHVLVGLYFIWIVVFGILMYMALKNVYSNENIVLSQLFMKWIFLNLIMGSALFMVIRIFRNQTVLNKIIFYLYVFMAIAAIVTVMIVGNTK